ncbi:MAG: 6-carboxytetrahydropterin synthase QueD [Proteobacteria bacterium]|nr:6-carboxytetrahydropterin synthase QueD [Pseudomonadota bacterium]NIS68127.1 6-carboxytetrahydropterin synthase QueD [Pseudomonadota bacterium]
MYEIKIEDRFSGAHRLRNYHGKCEALHGHNWRVEVLVLANSLDEAGMVLDFKILKETTRKVLGTLDHKYLNEVRDFLQVNPSSENIARYIFDRLKPLLEGHEVVLKKVTAWESDTACASYAEDNEP